MDIWNELLEEMLDFIEEIIEYNYQFAFTLEVTTEVDPLTFSKDTAIPQEVRLILSYEESASIGLSESVYRHTYLRTNISCTSFYSCTSMTLYNVHSISHPHPHPHTHT